MIATTQRGMNVALALAIPAAGLAYLTSGVSLLSSRSAGAWIAIGLLLVTAIIALNPVRHPQPVVIRRSIPASHGIPSYVIDVTRPNTPWRWTSVLLAPLELLVIAWSVPVIVFAILVPVGLAIASLVWLGRVILGL